MSTWQIALAAALPAAGSLVLTAVLLARSGRQQRELRGILTRQQEELRQLSEQGVAVMTRQDLMMQEQKSALEQVDRQLLQSTMQTEQKLEQMRRGIGESFDRVQRENDRQLSAIRQTVDEKLQETLDQKLSESFRLVSERLEQVYRGLGEMQNLAVGVGDLKKVLSNVKTRGIFGEVQLGAILEQMLAPEQYAVNVATKVGSRERVEYAVRLPGSGDEPVWLPIDAKFPLDAYEQLLSAYDTADPKAVETAVKALRQRVREFAKDVHEKYIDPPHTTEFAILFVPTEGLYAELVRAGMVEALHQEYHISLAGPTTMGALLNSLQMGFRTLAIQKYSGQVWKTLGSVKSEFASFAAVLEKAQQHLNQVGNDLETLSGVRTRRIQRVLRDVEVLPEIGQTEEEPRV